MERLPAPPPSHIYESFDGNERCRAVRISVSDRASFVCLCFCSAHVFHVASDCLHLKSIFGKSSLIFVYNHCGMMSQSAAGLVKLLSTNFLLFDNFYSIIVF